MGYFGNPKLRSQRAYTINETRATLENELAQITGEFEFAYPPSHCETVPVTFKIGDDEFYVKSSVKDDKPVKTQRDFDNFVGSNSFGNSLSDDDKTKFTNDGYEFIKTSEDNATVDAFTESKPLTYKTSDGATKEYKATLCFEIQYWEIIEGKAKKIGEPELIPFTLLTRERTKAEYDNGTPIAGKRVRLSSGTMATKLARFRLYANNKTIEQMKQISTYKDINGKWFTIKTDSELVMKFNANEAFACTTYVFDEAKAPTKSE